MKEADLFLKTLPRIAEEEVEKDIDAVLARVDAEGPIIIEAPGKRDLVLMGWEDYLQRCGAAHTAEELKELTDSCEAQGEKVAYVLKVARTGTVTARTVVSSEEWA